MRLACVSVCSVSMSDRSLTWASPSRGIAWPVSGASMGVGQVDGHGDCWCVPCVVMWSPFFPDPRQPSPEPPAVNPHAPLRFFFLGRFFLARALWSLKRLALALMAAALSGWTVAEFQCPLVSQMTSSHSLVQDAKAG